MKLISNIESESGGRRERKEIGETNDATLSRRKNNNNIQYQVRSKRSIERNLSKQEVGKKVTNPANFTQPGSRVNEVGKFVRLK